MKKCHQLLVWVVVLVLGSCSTDSEPEITLTEAPLSNAASDVSETSFTANWESVTGAKYYLIDVSTNVEFTSIIAEYSSKETTATSMEITGLSGSSKYFYRVKAGNSQGETDFSRIVPARNINKALLYDILWKGDEVKSQLSVILQDLTFNSNNNFTGSLGSFVVATGTWQWKNDTNVMSVSSSSGSYEFTWVDIEENYCATYASAITKNLIYYNK